MSSPLRIALGASLLAMVGGACAPPPRPKALPPQTVSQTTPDPPPPSEPPVAAPVKDSHTVVVEPGGKAAGPSLEEAVQSERERRRGLAKPTVVLTNENLAAYAEGKELTTMAAPAKAEATADAAGERARDEAYWRQGALDLRLRWRAAAEEIAAREQESEELRRRFYAEDDPQRRDTQVKPAWDYALERLARARLEADATRAELEAFIEQGRQAGALPGWLREGVEQEPTPEEPPSTELEPAEPVVVDEDGGRP